MIFLLFIIAGSGASLSCGSMTLSGSLSPTILPDAGPQIAPTVTNQQPQQQQQQQQTQADMHERVTTSSDITSIASQSPPYDTGQKRHYQTSCIHSHLPEMLLTNTPSLFTNSLNDSHHNRHNVIETDSIVENKYFDYGMEKLYTEFRFPSSGERKKTASVSITEMTVRPNINDPDILKDLGKPTRRGDSYWQRSASCKELGTLQKQERLLPKTDANLESAKGTPSAMEKFDSFRYCYSCHGQTPAFKSCSRRKYSTKKKVYSSSYPGTTLSATVDNDDNAVTAAGSTRSSIGSGSMFIIDKIVDANLNNDNIEYKYNCDDEERKVSQDDVSQDSYEILEREAAFRSRSNSVNSDEIFIMDKDYMSISKHILWKEGSTDVEKRLGYVEPRYRDIDFNEFNEICKRGFALRNRDASQSHGNIKFSEFTIKPSSNDNHQMCKSIEKRRPSIGHQENVIRTKSDPYVSGEHTSTNKKKLFGLHQKSFDLATSDFGEGNASKSTVDIPYTLRIRNLMNGTARDLESPFFFDDSFMGASRSKSEDTTVAFSSDSRNKLHGSHHASQDSGLSLSLGTESVDDNEIDLKNVLLTKNSYEEVVTTKKSTKLMLSLSEENNENVSGQSEQPSPLRQVEHILDDKEAAVNYQLNVEKHIMKVKSVEVPKKVHSTKIRKSRSAETYDRKSSFLRTDSSGSRGRKEIIVIDSDDYHSFDDSRSDKRSDGSDSVIIVEYRGNKKKRLSKKVSSDSRGSQAESEASSFDAPRIKKKELRKRNSAQTYFYKDRIPTIEISEDETYKAGNDFCQSESCQQAECEYSSDEKHVSVSDLSKTEVTAHILSEECAFVAEDDEQQSKEIELETDHAVSVAEMNIIPQSTAVSPPVCNAEKEHRESNYITAVVTSDKSSILLTRLGLSEGSATAQTQTTKTLSPSAARRAKSLDTSIVSLHRLPPITSFSSKDDTVDNEDGIVLEEKTSLKQFKIKTQTNIQTENSAESTKLRSTDNEDVRVSLNQISVSLSTLLAYEPELGTIPEKSKETKTEPIMKSMINRLKSNSIAVSVFRKPSLEVYSDKMTDINVLQESDSLNKKRSKSEGYDDNLARLKELILTPDRKHSTRQERLDSFKKLKNFSIELWDSKDIEGARKEVQQINGSKEYDDVFEDALEPPDFESQNVSASTSINEGKAVQKFKEDEDTNLLNVTSIHSTETMIDLPSSVPSPELSQVIAVLDPLLVQNYQYFLQPSTKSDVITSNNMNVNKTECEVEVNIPSLSCFECKIPEKRSFDEEPSTSSSIRPEPLKPTLESSGSSSIEEAILPPDYLDDEELPNIPSMQMNLDMNAVTSAKHGMKPLSGILPCPFSGGFFSLSRTLSRISERSTTSEQERTDFEDDSTKQLSRSLSIDDSILSSDQHFSFSSDPPSGMNLENVFDDDDLAVAATELDEDKLDFNIPPPLLSPEEEWPSPPHSSSSLKTPVIDDKGFSVSPNLKIPETSSRMNEGEEEGGSFSEDNKTLQDGEDMSEHESEDRVSRKERPRGSIGDDTSAGITTSDWSSSTGTTVKNANAGLSCASKSEDNSLNCEFGTSLSTEVMSESRKNSADDMAQMPYEKKYLTLDRKQTSADRKLVLSPATFHSFDDEYDSPYTESEDTPSSPIPATFIRKPQSLWQQQPPVPPRHYQDTSNIHKMRARCERNRAAKFLPHYTSSSMSTSLESPTNAERKFAKTIAKAKCYSYYSLARSPPSDGSSSSAEAPETPLTPNTIPRVSKKRRNSHTMRRRQQRSNDLHTTKLDYSTSPSSASHASHVSKQFYYPSRRGRQY